MNKTEQARHSAYLEGKAIGLKGFQIKEGRQYRRWVHFNAFRSGWREGVRLYQKRNLEEYNKELN